MKGEPVNRGRRSVVTERRRSRDRFMEGRAFALCGFAVHNIQR